MSQFVIVDYNALKDEYQLALDKIGYCDTFNIINNDQDDEYYEDRYLMTENSASYGLSYYGNKYVDIFNNKLPIFIYIFYEMLFGYLPDREIKFILYH